MVRLSAAGRRAGRVCLVAAVAMGVVLATSTGSAGASGRPADLDPARSALAARLVPHSSVGIDPATNQVVVTIADAARGTDALVSAANAYSSAVRIERVPGRFDTMAGHFRGGNGIVDVNGSASCTLGFNTTGGKALTAGHCTQIVGAWNKENNGQFIGPSIGSNFPGDDFGLIRNDGSMKQRGDVQAYDASIQDITGAADPFPGQPICKSGRTTLRTCGVVTRVNVTVNYPQGTVFGLGESNLCVQPGDSGGPVYSGSTAIGLISGGTLGLPCGHPSFRSFFQPVTEALNFYGVNVF